MFMDATPDHKLLKILKRIEDKFKVSETDRIKLVSKTGTKLSNIVQQRDPFKS